MSDKVLEKKYNKTEVDNLLNNKLSLTGGTITGMITYKRNDADVSKANNNVPSGILYPSTMNIIDVSGRIVNRMEGQINSNGKTGGYWYCRNYDTSGTQIAAKGIKMEMDKTGNLTWTVDDAANFRSAISAAPKNSLEDANSPSRYPKLGIQWSGSGYTTFDYACVWGSLNGFDQVVGGVSVEGFKKVLSSRLPTIQKILKNLGDVTVSSNGYTDIRNSTPSAPTGYTFLFAMLNNWSTSTNNNMFLVTSNGQYLMAPNGTTVTNLRIDYFYILTQNMKTSSV